MTTTVTFTPGPWSRNGQTTLGWRIDGTTDRVGLDFLNNPVAIVPLAADADLIAAAPELLAAAYARFDELREWWTKHGKTDVKSLAPSDELVLAAIAKAEGRAQS